MEIPRFKPNAAEVRKLHRKMHKTPYQANRVLALLG